MSDCKRPTDSQKHPSQNSVNARVREINLNQLVELNDSFGYWISRNAYIYSCKKDSPLLPPYKHQIIPYKSAGLVLRSGWMTVIEDETIPEVEYHRYHILYRGIGFPNGEYWMICDFVPENFETDLPYVSFVDDSCQQAYPTNMRICPSSRKSTISISS